MADVRAERMKRARVKANELCSQSLCKGSPMLIYANMLAEALDTFATEEVQPETERLQEELDEWPKAISRAVNAHEASSWGPNDAEVMLHDAITAARERLELLNKAEAERDKLRKALESIANALQGDSAGRG